MKKLSDFKGMEGIQKAADILCIAAEVLSDPKNAPVEKDEMIVETFARYVKNSPEQMMKIFGILSDCENYSCNGAEALENLIYLSNDQVIVVLFTSQGQKRGATSSGSASESAGI